MSEIDERKLKESFNLQKEQCSILLDAMINMVQDLKKYDSDLECKVLDNELSSLIQEQTKQILNKEVNLKNTINCISSTLGDMKEEFANFEHNENTENFYPNFIFQLKEQIKLTNESGVSKSELENDYRLAQIKEVIRELQVNNEENEDFTEISARTQLDKIPIDPFTQKEIEIPVRNKLCRHIYDKDGIMNYISQRQQLGKNAKCPKIGCAAKLTFNNLIEDNDLKEKIDRLRHNNS